MWKKGDPFTDGSYAREADDPQIWWDALHGVEDAEIQREILDWWKDKPHQVAAEICEGWRQANTKLAAAEARAEVAEKSLHEHTNQYIEAAHDLSIRVEKAEAEVARLRRESDVREPVQWFAEQMERKLKANDHKSHWSGCDALWLFERLLDEAGELRRTFRLAVPVGCFVDTPSDVERVVSEAADVANFAMMIADNARAALAAKED